MFDVNYLLKMIINSYPSEPSSIHITRYILDDLSVSNTMIAATILNNEFKLKLNHE